MPLCPKCSGKAEASYSLHLQCPSGQGKILFPCSLSLAEASSGVWGFSGSNFLVTLTKGIIFPESSEAF